MGRVWWMAGLVLAGGVPLAAQDHDPAMKMPVQGPAATAANADHVPPAPTLPAADKAGPARPEGHDHMSGPMNGMAHDDGIVPVRPTLLPGYGGGGFPITTTVPQAQAFFANGMELGAAFAHKAATAAMAEAVRLDPACAMCLWGEALVDGPTINFGKDDKERKALGALVARARPLAKAHGTERERALIDALALRYRPGKATALDTAYARAMARVQKRWPADNEIAVLTADAEMVAAFRRYDDAGDDGADPTAAVQADVRPAVALLETVLARAPDHTPAIHFYIHATEVLQEPARAETYADKLGTLAPRASHLVHMPSHTYYWVGRYQDAADANRRAVAIGEDNARRLGLGPPDGVWGLPYHAHNVIFGLGGALMAGDSAAALALARPLVARAAARTEAEPFSQLLSAAGWFAITRFDPASVPDLPEPKLPYMQAAWHYARGEAAAWRGDLAALEAERAAIPEHVAKDKPTRETRGPETMLTIVRAVLDGRKAMAEKRWDDAARAFRAGAEAEETPAFLQFSDPPAFWYPVRRDLAAALLAKGDKAGAKTEILASLKLRPRDPVAEALLARL